MTPFWITLLVCLPVGGTFLGWRLAREDRRITGRRDSVLRDIDIEDEAEKDND